MVSGMRARRLRGRPESGRADSEIRSVLRADKANNSFASLCAY